MQSQRPEIPLQTFTLQSTDLRGSLIRTNQKNDEAVARQEDSCERIASPEELASPALPPVDRGVKAWTFVAAAFVLETLVWGFGFTLVHSWISNALAHFDWPHADMEYFRSTFFTNVPLGTLRKQL